MLLFIGQMIENNMFIFQEQMNFKIKLRQKNDRYDIILLVY